MKKSKFPLFLFGGDSIIRKYPIISLSIVFNYSMKFHLLRVEGRNLIAEEMFFLVKSDHQKNSDYDKVARYVNLRLGRRSAKNSLNLSGTYDIPLPLKSDRFRELIYAILWERNVKMFYKILEEHLI